MASRVATWWSWVPDRWRRSPCSTCAAAASGPVRILNRSLEHARALAERTNAEHGDLDALPAALAHADLVVSATGAAGIVVHARRGRAAPWLDRPARPLALIDLAVPRDVDPEAAAIEGVHVIDIVTLRERLADRDEETAAADRRRPHGSWTRRSAATWCAGAATNSLR